MKSPAASTEILNSDPILAEIVRSLVAEFRPYKIFLFGSRASGNARNDSDYDILVVMPELTEGSRKLAVRAYRILKGLGVAKDILFTSREKFELRKTVVNTLAEIATNDGKEIYVAA